MSEFPSEESVFRLCGVMSCMCVVCAFKVLRFHCFKIGFRNQNAGGFGLMEMRSCWCPQFARWTSRIGTALCWWPGNQRSERLPKQADPYFERLGLRAWPGSTVNFSLRIDWSVPRATSLHFPRSESRNVLWLCFLWVRVVAPLMSQCFFCFPVSL